ncbi:hypothetical protein KIPB_005859 [Kipferlia bialata]|uniref:Uncharacterized protein n=1 Tax=Kipferlia bialata TaxID=797122 RepID=A0A9K3CZ70_9EUKA|nr:hypothetical protein KIPB_005859 [Kipferlia bialata]|eukprot:g5859.t1
MLLCVYPPSHISAKGRTPGHAVLNAAGDHAGVDAWLSTRDALLLDVFTALEGHPAARGVLTRLRALGVGLTAWDFLSHYACHALQPLSRTELVSLLRVSDPRDKAVPATVRACPVSGDKATLVPGYIHVTLPDSSSWPVSLCSELERRGMHYRLRLSGLQTEGEAEGETERGGEREGETEGDAATAEEGERERDWVQDWKWQDLVMPPKE